MALHILTTEPPTSVMGIAFYPVADETGQRYGDFVGCGVCREIVDIGGELRIHVMQHQAEGADV